ncbi:helix-turn-helix domain-containing protein [Methylobrevis albus]|uniref:Helix-turn-helix transcriptional regulator n=1 Tax=Methylobrevis albus TaxID=2793297 RepID=A0A931HY20_9HYPH|nr:helix-turn-helix transcriptional regulator [Methylobrevis albus]MBH0236432.1 helix-turn-helix transcriptional regulator [Methylobrevis albus]
MVEYDARRGAIFPSRLARIMKEKRLSQSEIAKKVGYTPTAIWNWLQGNTLPRPETLASLAETLNVREEWLMGETEQRSRGPIDEGIEATEVEDESGIEGEPQVFSISLLVESLRTELASATGFELEQIKIKVEFAS